MAIEEFDQVAIEMNECLKIDFLSRSTEGTLLDNIGGHVGVSENLEEEIQFGLEGLLQEIHEEKKESGKGEETLPNEVTRRSPVARKKVVGNDQISK